MWSPILFLSISILREETIFLQDGASWIWQWEIYYNFMGTSYISLMEIFENWQCSRIIIVNAKWLNLLK